MQYRYTINVYWTGHVDKMSEQSETKLEPTRQVAPRFLCTAKSFVTLVLIQEF